MAEAVVFHPLEVSTNNFPSLSLKDLCRRCILQRLDLQSIQQVDQLPLPKIVKAYIDIYQIPGDFDTGDENVAYHGNFLNHWHHPSHQVHAATCHLTRSKVLLACIDPSKNSYCCESIFRRSIGMYAPPENRREAVNQWYSMEHENLMKCILALIDKEGQREVYVLDFPVMNLQHFVEKANEAQISVTDFLVWQTLSKLTSVLLYLAERKVIAWDLCQLQHVVLMEGGEVKLENMLLYQPAMMATSVCSHSWDPWPPCFAPELRWGGVGTPALVWALGFIVNELIKPLQSVPVKKAMSQDSGQTPTYLLQRSSSLTRLTSQCSRKNPADRPSLEQLHRMARSEAEAAAQGYTGPRTLLTLLGQS